VGPLENHLGPVGNQYRPVGRGQYGDCRDQYSVCRDLCRLVDDHNENCRGLCHNDDNVC
jgi:hypothetical protein